MNKYFDKIKEIDLLKEKIKSTKPLKPFELSELKEYYKIGLTYTSNALEGNSLTESETKIVIEDGLTINGKPLKYHFEAIGHADAYDFMYDLIKKDEIKENHILKLHKLFFYRIDIKNAGKYRKVKIFVTGSKYNFPEPEKVQNLIEKFFSNIIKYQKKYHPVVAAALIHKEFVEIHPFIDGNGRCARLLMNLILLKHGYGICIIPPILRNQYITTIEKAHHGKEEDFILFISEMVYESLKEYIRLFG